MTRFLYVRNTKRADINYTYIYIYLYKSYLYNPLENMRITQTIGCLFMTEKEGTDINIR